MPFSTPFLRTVTLCNTISGVNKKDKKKKKKKIQTLSLNRIGRFHPRRRTSLPTICTSNVNSNRTTHLVLVIVNSYREGQTDDFESQVSGTNRIGYLAIGKNGCHQVHME